MVRAFAFLLAALVTLLAWVVAFRPGPRGAAALEMPARAAGAPATALGLPAGRTDEEWRRSLSPLQYDVLRRGGTERAFTGAHWNRHAPGVYRCAGCGAVLFLSQAKFDSGTGWPSFFAPATPAAVREQEDAGLFERRVEVLCARCGGHLGHVFGDGPAPSGLRYCVNSASLLFEPAAPEAR